MFDIVFEFFNDFQEAIGIVVNLFEHNVHGVNKDAEFSKETKRCVAQSKSPGADEQKLAVFLLLAWLIES